MNSPQSTFKLTTDLLSQPTAALKRQGCNEILDGDFRNFRTLLRRRKGGSASNECKKKSQLTNKRKDIVVRWTRGQ